MHRITVINLKGGCGKTTIATNVAAAFAVRGRKTTLIDYDPQNSSTYWLNLRSDKVAHVDGIVAYPTNRSVTRSWQLKLPLNTEYAIVDTPAGLKGLDLVDQLHGTHTILVPVLPSVIDTHATADFIRDLYLVAKIRSSDTRLCIVCNRVKSNTLSFRALERFLVAMDIPVIAQLRDTQNYNKAMELGLGVHELDSNVNQKDVDAWQQLVDWLDIEQQVEHVTAVSNHQ